MFRAIFIDIKLNLHGMKRKILSSSGGVSKYELMRVGIEISSIFGCLGGSLERRFLRYQSSNIDKCVLQIEMR